MSLLLQQILVGVLVVACALLSAWRLATVRLRLRALDALDAVPLLRRVPGCGRLRRRTLARQLSACGGCAPGAHRGAAGAVKPGAPSRSQTPGALRR